MMKKVIATLMTAAMAMSLVACGGGGDTAPAQDAGPAQDEAPAADDAEAPADDAAAAGDATAAGGDLNGDGKIVVGYISKKIGRAHV